MASVQETRQQQSSKHMPAKEESHFGQMSIYVLPNQIQVDVWSHQ